MGNITSGSNDPSSSLFSPSSSSSSSSSSNNNKNGTTGGFFYWYKTWSIKVAEKWLLKNNSNSQHKNNSKIWDCESICCSNNYSQYSFCSCSQCQRDDGFSSWCDSDLFDSASSMAPNSEESSRIGPFTDDILLKEKQRPPIYNPEDYAFSLRKWGKRPSNGATSSSSSSLSSCIYSNQNNELEANNVQSNNNNFRDYRNPMLLSSGSEMTLRQFGTVSELLTKLKNDLRLAFPSFVQEFVADPLDGVTLLIDLLRAIQLSQSTGTTGCSGKLTPAIHRKTLLDELACLQCLLSCTQRYSDSVRKLTSSSAGLYTLSVCIMSNVTKSRVLALQLLTKALEAPYNAHMAVSEAMFTLRLRFGEPVRFRFLIGMLLSAGGQGDLLVSGMRFLNQLLDSSESPQKRMYLQAELEQAGFDIATIKKNINSNLADQIFKEMDHWEKNFLDVESLIIRMENSEKENDNLRDKIVLLEKRVEILQEEKGVLVSLEKCLKERCCELQDQVHSLKSDSQTNNKSSKDSRQEDEGISSSDQSFSHDENDLQQESSVYEIFSIESATLPVESKIEINDDVDDDDDDDDDETTIEEVIEELKNIINDAETEVYKNEKRQIENENLKKSKENNVENEIIPSNLHPQPPRKTRSLVHLFIPTEDYDYNQNELFFEENETSYSSEEEGSDSLLSASKYQMPRIDQKFKRTTTASKLKRAGSFRIKKQISLDGRHSIIDDMQRLKINHQDPIPTKCKSLERITDNPLLINNNDITVTTEQKIDSIHGVSRVFITPPYQDKKMFFPIRDNVPCYFPRIQEKKLTNFQIKRGHTNAGLYSGQSLLKETNANIKNRDFLPIPSLSSITNNKSASNCGKVSDYPSGLY